MNNLSSGNLPINQYLFDREANPSLVFESKYISDIYEPKGSFPNDIKLQMLGPEIQAINSSLRGLCQERMGNITSGDPKQVQKTIQLINSLICLRRKDIQSKNQFVSSARKYQAEKANLLNQIQKLSRQKKNADSDKQILMQKIKTLERQFKEITDKINAQKDQAQKQLVKIQNRQVQFQNQCRKKQNTIRSLQETIKKFQQKHPFKNTFEVIQPLIEHGPSIYHVNADHQFNSLVTQKVDQSYDSLRQQNQFYKDCLTAVYRELHSVLEVKKQILRRRGYQYDFQSSFDLKVFRPQILALPNQFSKEGFDLLQANISKFKEAIQMGDNEDKIEDQKVNCVNNVKNLLRNYKGIVQSQQQLLNKVILKAKQFKANDLAFVENKYSKNIQQDQLQRAKQFLSEQSKYLEGKNRELETTRRAMQTSMKRAQEQRNEMIKKKGQLQQQALKIRKKIEILPTMIEQQLANRK